MPSATSTEIPSVALAELANELGPRIARLVRLLLTETAGVSRTQHSVLATLRDSGPTRVTALAERERVAQPSMTALVTRMERAGLVERHAEPDDGRVVNVGITAAGRAALDRMTAARAAALARRLEALSDGERATLAAALPALDRLIDA